MVTAMSGFARGKAGTYPASGPSVPLESDPLHLTVTVDDMMPSWAQDAIEYMTGQATRQGTVTLMEATLMVRYHAQIAWRGGDLEWMTDDEFEQYHHVACKTGGLFGYYLHSTGRSL